MTVQSPSLWWLTPWVLYLLKNVAVLLESLFHDILQKYLKNGKEYFHCVKTAGGQDCRRSFVNNKENWIYNRQFTSQRQCILYCAIAVHVAYFVVLMCCNEVYSTYERIACLKIWFQTAVVTSPMSILVVMISVATACLHLTCSLSQFSVLLARSFKKLQDLSCSQVQRFVATKVLRKDVTPQSSHNLWNVFRWSFHLCICPYWTYTFTLHCCSM